MASGPICNICMQIFTSGSAVCTASVMSLCPSASASVESFDAVKTASPFSSRNTMPPSSFGAMPPVIIMPTRPRRVRRNRRPCAQIRRAFFKAGMHRTHNRAVFNTEPIFNGVKRRLYFACREVQIAPGSFYGRTHDHLPFNEIG